jgi:pSer/pThr/pTyr-binding forkhead associated (FHA) protein
MEKYKICKRCGAHNPIDEIMCIECMGIEFIYPDENEQNTNNSIDINEQTYLDSNSEKTYLDEEKKLFIIFEDKEFLVDNNTIIGRENFLKEILQNYKTVSRSHAKFTYDGENWYIQDLNSTNGTFVNGEKINNKKLLNNDIINLSTKFTFKVKII